MKQVGFDLFSSKTVVPCVIAAASAAALVLISGYSYLLFHTLAELVSIAIAWSLFILAWNTRRYTSDNGLLLMGIGIFLASLIDLAHVLSYKGMNILPGYASNLTTQLWIAARYIQGFSLLAVSIQVQRQRGPVSTRTAIIVLIMGAFITSLLLAAIFGGIFPDCYEKETGLTPFKKASEIVISLFLLAAIGFFLRARRRFDRNVLRLLLASIVLMIASELLFIFYFSAYDLSNLAGHILKIASFILLYFAIVYTGLEKPYALMFREMKRTEDVLRASESRFRKIFEEGRFGIVISSPEARFITVNAAFSNMTGYTPEELASMSFMDITHPDHLEKDSEGIRALGDGEIPVYRAEKKYVTKGGSAIWGDATISAIRDENGKLLYFLGMIQDITERRKTDAALRESEELYRTALESSNDAVSILSNGRYQYANQTFFESFGISAEDLPGIPHGAMTHPEDRERIRDYHRLLMQGRPVPTHYEFRGIKKDGSTVYLEASVSLITYQGEKAQLSFMRNITPRKLSELALRQSEERYRTIVESIEDGYFEIDLKGRYTFINDALCRQFGYSREELFKIDYRKLTTPKGAIDLFQYYNELYRTGLPKLFTYQILDKHGEVRDREIYASLVRDASGKPLGFRGIGRDITERKRAEEEKKKLADRLHQAQKMEAIGTLAGGIAHDFNNILASIMGFAELIKIRTGSREMDGNIDQILKASLRARDLVNQILTFSRHKEKEVQAVNLEMIVAETMKLLRATIPSTIEISARIEPRPYAVMADSTEIYQVIMNLCTNAFHSMRDRGGILEISLKSVELGDNELQDLPDLKPGKYVELSISDTGTGIEREIIGRIFDPFFTTKERGTGTGLGLAVVYGIVKEYGGTVLVRSEPGKGSTFSIYLPAVESKAVVQQAPERRLPRGSERILFVDDEKVLVEIGRQMLGYLGYRVEAAASSIQALDIFRKDPGRFDLVMTDMTMPGMTGADLAREILRIRPDIPIILCTGYSEILTKENAKAHGIREVLTKPFSLEQLAGQIRTVLEPEKKQSSSVA